MCPRGADNPNGLMKKVRTDRRQFARFDILEYAVIQRDSDPQASSCVVVDVSLGGLQIRTREAFQPGEQCSITIGRGGVRPVSSRVEVRYVERADDSELYAIGLKFLPTETKDRMAMVDYIHDVFRRQGEMLLS